MELWCFSPADGNHLNLRAAPHLDASGSGHALAPGDRFEVVEKVQGNDEVTFLRLRDGRGWAFDGKPSSSIWGWLPFASGSQKMVLCSPVHPPVPPVLGTGAAAAGAFVGRQGTTPSIFASRFPTAQSEPVQPETPEMGVGLLGRTAPPVLQNLHEHSNKGTRPAAPSVLPTANGASAATKKSANDKPKLHVRVECAHDLRNMDFGAFFGNKSDPYVVVRFGAEEKKTPVIDDNLDPVWHEGREFTFTIPEEPPTLIELEVFNSNTFVDDTLGKTSIAFSTIPATGQWLHRRDPLVGKSMVTPAQGELQYEVMLDAKASSGRHGPAARGSTARAVGPGMPAPPPEDMEPGAYKVTMSTAVYRTSTKCTDRDVVAHVEQGQQVQVEEVMNCLSEERVRGLISEPRGWIPLMDTRDGFRWVQQIVRQKYLVDNSWLKSPCGGLAYRFSKEVKNKDERPGEQGGAPWSSVVVGEDQGDGWLKVADGRLLPMNIQGVPVLKALDDGRGVDRTTAQAEDELDRLYRELNRRMEGVKG